MKHFALWLIFISSISTLNEIQTAFQEIRKTQCDLELANKNIHYVTQMFNHLNQEGSNNNLENNLVNVYSIIEKKGEFATINIQVTKDTLEKIMKSDVNDEEKI